MGYLFKGEWKKQAVNPETEDGEFHRQEQAYRSWIEEGGEHPPEADRYHLYISYACPWAHRVLIMRKLKGLDEIMDYSVVSPEMLDMGWSFKRTDPGVSEDKVYGKEYLKDVYAQLDPNFTGRVTVPVLLDRKAQKIVNNESSELVRILNGSFNSFAKDQTDYYPSELREEIDRVNADIYDNINNGVYKTGFARNQEAYEKNFVALFEALDRQEKRLEGRNFLVGERLTEADIRFFTTLIRFDAVYFTHFKCNKRMIKDYKNLSRYLKSLYSRDEFRSTTRLDHIKRHYYYSHETLNPFRLVPLGPDLDYLN